MEKYIHAFWHINNTDYKRLEKIWRYFGDFKEAWCEAKAGDFVKAGLDKEYIDGWQLLNKKLDLEAAMDKLWRNDIVPIWLENKEFPDSLKNIEKCPFMLYRKGSPLFGLEKSVAIVGMRKASLSGEKIAFNLAKTLAFSGIPIISGLAFGIDAAAHSGVVTLGKPTIGVLASGIGKITPTSHYDLAQRMLKCGGSIVSEYPVTSNAFKERFIERNRIIAGLAKAVVVVEAAERSGALITARYALDQGKDVMAFPGDSGKIQSMGCNNLIKKGEAQLVDSIKDVMNVLGEDSKQLNLIEALELNIQEKKVMALLKQNRLETQEMFERLKWDFADLQGILGKLEMAGLIFKNSSHKWEIIGY